MTIKEKYANSIVLQHDYATGSMKGQNGENDGLGHASIEWQNDIHGRCLEFNKTTNGSVSVQDADNLSFGNGLVDKPFSMVALVKPRDVSSFYLYGKGVVAASEFAFFMASNGKLYIRCYDTASATVFIGQKYDVALTSYEHKYLTIAATYDGSGTSAGFKIFINGIFVPSLASEVNPSNYTAMGNKGADAQIGGLSTLANDGFTNEVTVFNDLELTNQEVAKLHEEIMAKVIYTVPEVLHTIKPNGNKDDVYIASGLGWNVTQSQESGEGTYLSNTGWQFADGMLLADVVDFSDYKGISGQMMGDLQRPSEQMAGTWEVDFSMFGSFNFDFIVNGATGYRLEIGYNTYKVVEIGVGDIAVGVWTSDDSVHSAKVTRNNAGEFVLYLDGVEMATGTNTNITVCKQMKLGMATDTICGNFRVTPLNY